MKYQKTRIEVCPDCLGEERMWIQTQSPRHGSDKGEGFYKTCNTCEGSGRVKIKKEITITPFKPITNEHK
jgi:DNA-directed RNA polymerase subunit M/transcription elongation factor TFIIS